MQTLLLFVGILTAIAYALMWVDKLKSIYRWWRISEKMLWIFAVCG